MRNYVIRPANQADAESVADNLRGDDFREVVAASGRPPRDVLVDGVWDSIDSRAFEINGELCGVYGVTRTDVENLGLVWMVGTYGIDRHWRTFLRHSRSQFQTFHDYYPALFNFVDARNTLHVKWLQWVGCRFVKRHLRFGAEQREFLEFIHV